MKESVRSGFSVEEAGEELIAISERHRGEKGNTIVLLQELQEAFGYIPEEAVKWVAECLGIPESRFFGIATFYAQFHLAKRGRNIITACSGTACHVKGAEKLIARAQRELGLNEGEGTTGDLEFTLEKVACLGTCSMAPAVVINRSVYGRVKPERLAREIKGLKKRK
jgi:NADH:ubiquinone oxidoreductase subunit E